jgi:hypothetical protein
VTEPGALFVITKRAVEDVSAFGLELVEVLRLPGGLWCFAALWDRQHGQQRVLREEEIAAIVWADVGHEDDVIAFVDDDENDQQGSLLEAV